MGARGPLPKNTALKMQSGVIPLQKSGTELLMTDFELPKPPKHFTKAEKHVWKITVSLIKKNRIIERIDQAVLGAYCDAYVKWQKAEKELQRIEENYGVNEMLLSTGANFNKIANPLLSISRRAQQDMVYYAAQMGMTPAARMRVKIITPKEKENPFMKLKRSDEQQLDANRQGLRQIIYAEAN